MEERFTNVYCPNCRKFQPSRFDLLKARAYADRCEDIVCRECESVIATLHASPDMQ
jgi:hypothetical protein